MKTHDEHLRDILKLANAEHGKFAIEIGFSRGQEWQTAFETGLHEDLYRLIDISPASSVPGPVFRIFRLTDIGHYRLAKLEGRTS